VSVLKNGTHPAIDIPILPGFSLALAEVFRK
jgi:hypothetical protein